MKVDVESLSCLLVIALPAYSPYFDECGKTVVTMYLQKLRKTTHARDQRFQVSRLIHKFAGRQLTASSNTDRDKSNQIKGATGI